MRELPPTDQTAGTRDERLPLRRCSTTIPCLVQPDIAALPTVPAPYGCRRSPHRTRCPVPGMGSRHRAGSRCLTDRSGRWPAVSENYCIPNNLTAPSWPFSWPSSTCRGMTVPTAGNHGFATDEQKDKYGFSDDSWTRATKQLVHLGVLEVTRKVANGGHESTPQPEHLSADRPTSGY